MPFCYEIVDCQNPLSDKFICQTFQVVKVVFRNKLKTSTQYYEKAWDLAKKVNPKKANNATDVRERERLMLDALGGVLAEYGWYYYINRIFGDETVSFTDFNPNTAQIDLRLNNGKTIEVRSSFLRNGVKFALCSQKFNFRNICKYDNLYKPSEADKDFFACALFETQKTQLLSANEVVFYLVGGSSKQMMEDDTLAYEADLIAEDDIVKQKTKYRVIELQNALDMAGFERYLQAFGYQQVRKPLVGEWF